MKLSEFFAQTPSGALAFSGGTDSSFLAWTAMKYGTGWKAYYIKTAFQPTFELEDAKRVAEQCGIPLRIIPVDVFAQDAVTANPSNRCYFCKRILFEQVLKQATKDGCQLVIDGTNASDDAGDRPGMQALRELEVRSPLREAGLTKADVRRLSREAGLFTWDKPSYACLATRIPTGTVITQEALEKVERGEQLLREAGFRDIRIRLHGNAAVLQFPQEDMERAWTRREELHNMLSPLFPLATIDLAPRLSKD